MPRPLTDEEKALIWVALGMRRNYIETGDIALDAASLSKISDKTALGRGVEVKALSIDQMKHVIASQELITKVLQDKLLIDD